ncbi:putative aldehyde oxidase Art an 7 [Coffea arabica]|uniref:Aldehyde oxidase Art an 7 n=1 Tax=Coffea arabica TaxID=13443 RepID=A0ABM4UUR7_COFAR
MAVLFKAFLVLPLVFLGTFAGTPINQVQKHGFSLGIRNPFGSIQFGFGGQDGGNFDGFQQPPDGTQQPSGKKLEFLTNFRGRWEIHSENAGVSAMQFQLLPNNKAVWFDTTNLGPSGLQFDPPYCHPNFNNASLIDCYAHAVEYDTETGSVRPLKFSFDPWCSSGGLAANGEIISTGGAIEAMRAVRTYTSCDNCEFQENQVALAENRWYSGQQTLEDGSFLLVGGRDVFSYEIVPQNQLQFEPRLFQLPFLRETRDEKENNLYPFVYLLPDGNVYVFANSKSIILNPYTGETIRQLPELAGGSRNYPVSGMSVLLPLQLSADGSHNVDVEVMVCGGNAHDAFKYAENPPRKFLPALNDCNRLSLTQENADWDKEIMPSRRTMGDALLLPTGDVLMLNGAKAGTSAWESADDANFTPVLYRPSAAKGKRFKTLKPTQIARMYHSTSALLIDGKILVAGSNPHQFYTFNVKYPTELRVEKFTPPYLAPELDKHRPVIVEDASDKQLKYGQQFVVNIKLDDQVDASDIKVTMYPPPFTTHGFSQSQRLLVLGLTQVTNQQITAVAPPSGKIAPPGYYMLFVVHRGVPSRGMWVHIM